MTRVREQFPEAELRFVPGDQPVADDVAGEVLLTLPWGAPNLPELVTRGVRWIHTLGTGVDRFPLEKAKGAILTCARGSSAVPMAEWVIGACLAFEKRWPQTWLSAPPERWNVADLGTLEGKTLGLVGVGEIARAVAERARPFGMRIRALRRRPAPSPLPYLELAPDLEDLLASADHVVLAAASTAATARLIDARALTHVKPGVHLVNVSRGALVDHDALRVALEDGRVATASLDVVDPEPLPSGHWLYTHPRVRLTAHISWCRPRGVERILESFLDNLSRWQTGAPLAGQVDLEAGY
jgi:phosphoglycerate dehydrogenase-like enzyme